MFLALVAYGAGLLGMAVAQRELIGNVQFRLVLIFAEMALALPAVGVAAILAARMRELYRFAPLTAPAVVKTFVLGLALWALSLGVFEAQYVFVKPPLAYLEQFQGLHAMLKPTKLLGWVFSIGAIAIAPAVCEEVLFRGLLTPVFKRGLGVWAALIIPSALFAAIHVDTMRDGTTIYYRVPFAFILGVLLAKLRLDTGSLWPPIIAHATLNATTFILVLIMDEPRGLLPEPQPLVALGMLVVGSVVARLLMRSVRSVEPATA